MKIKENNDEYILIQAEADWECAELAKAFNAHDISLWISKEGRLDGIKLWKKDIPTIRTRSVGKSCTCKHCEK